MMTNYKTYSRLALTVLLAAGLAVDFASAAGVTVRVGDVTKIKGQRINRLVGMGLVTGLNGTGDSDDYLPAMQPLAAVLKQYSNPVGSIEDLAGSKSVAIVMVEATLPEFGVREGDQIDVQVTAIGSAKSLKGGRLLITPLLYHDRAVETVFAFASGPVHVLGEEEATAGTIRNGATCEEDVLLHFLAKGRDLPFTSDWIKPDNQYVTLVVDENHAGWAMVKEIAWAIDTDSREIADVERVAQAVDPRNVVVLVPPEQDVASWLWELEHTQLLVPESEAQVIVDRNTGTIVVSGNARISPVIISQKGLTLTITAPPVEGTAPVPVLQSQSFVAVDPNNAGGTNVADLLEALKPLNVPIEDRIEILTKIHQLGKLHAKLIFED